MIRCTLLTVWKILFFIAILSCRQNLSLINITFLFFLFSFRVFSLFLPTFIFYFFCLIPIFFIHLSYLLWISFFSFDELFFFLLTKLFLGQFYDVLRNPGYFVFNNEGSACVCLISLIYTFYLFIRFVLFLLCLIRIFHHFFY